MKNASNNNPSISVIMGVYNANKDGMLKTAIDSILNQTFSDFEFIICDDGSTDGTYDLLKKITKNDKRVKIIRNDKNCGLAYSLNHCLEVSKGRYIARMDADDISELDRFNKQVDFLNSHKEYVLVSSFAKLFNSESTWGFLKNPERPTKDDLMFAPPFIHAAMMMQKCALDDLGGYRVARETRRTEDIDLWMRLYAKGYKGYNIQIPLYNIREDSATYSRRKYRYRIDEAIVRYKGFRNLSLLPRALPFVLKPLIVGIIPARLLVAMRKLRQKSKYKE